MRQRKVIRYKMLPSLKYYIQPPSDFSIFRYGLGNIDNYVKEEVIIGK